MKSSPDMSTTTPRAELGTASAILRPVASATEMSSSPVSRATTTSSRCSISTPIRSSTKVHLPLPQPAPEADGGPLLAGLHRNGIHQRPHQLQASAVVVDALVAPAAVVVHRDLDDGAVALAGHLEARAVRGARVLDRVGRGLAAGGRDLGDLQVVRARVREP